MRKYICTPRHPENEFECILGLARMIVMPQGLIPKMETLSNCWYRSCRRVRGSSATTVVMWGYRLEMQVLEQNVIIATRWQEINLQ